VLVVAAVLLLLAVGLLAGGLAQGSAALQWASFAASALAAVLLGLGELRRRRRAAAPGPARAGARRGPSTAPGAPGRAAGSAGSPSRPVTAPKIPVYGRPPPEPETEPGIALAREEPPAPGSALHEPAPPPVAESLGSLAQPIGPTTGAHAAPDEPAAPMTPRSGGAHSAEQPAALALGEDGEPPVEEVEVTDLLLVLDLTDEVLVVDEHPRYHLDGCPHLSGQQTFGMPRVEARTDGFTPCAACAPDRHLAMDERARRAGR
jgi:hypothetical protein